MPHTPFADMSCSVARTLDIIGDRWTPLVLRDVALGISRFDRIQSNLGVSRKVLTQRLNHLVEHGVVQRVAYQEHPPRHDYHLTERGAELAVVLLAVQSWGDRWVPTEDGPPVVWRHERCGQFAQAQVTCSCCGEPLRAGEVVPFLGPRTDPGPGASEVPAAVARIHALAGIEDERPRP
ncbi:putative HTH-type transcriptional regulator [Paraconexibacter sp. AEG42_29]|uniref:HTH-type transcriptional regulator n=1 Tax=Paraconexibacter sp. AEG42_29 TaxID=2997339 RepID=A0AAU7ARR1_9ACTN